LKLQSPEADKYPDQLRFAFRHFPLEGVYPNAELAAEAAECAGSQGKYWQVHDLPFDNQQCLLTSDLVDACILHQRPDSGCVVRPESTGPGGEGANRSLGLIESPRGANYMLPQHQRRQRNK
jgi:hypothetical protein